MTELVLAFDADCARCRAVARAVADSGLDVLPLSDYRVVDWCAETGTAPDTPVLFAITTTDGDDRVRAWTGPRLLPTLAARLGPRRTARIARALRAQGLWGDALRATLRRSG